MVRRAKSARSPKPPHMVFGGGIGTGLGHGRLIAWNPETGQKRNVTPWPEVHGFSCELRICRPRAGPG